MSSDLINVLDSYTIKQNGEKGHTEYGWSNNIREKIVQFYFQLTRTKNTYSLETSLSEMLFFLKNQIQVISIDEYNYYDYLIILYKMIGHTRDISEGKGEYFLTYMMIYVWYDFFPEFAIFALKCLCECKEEILGHPYGSWKDIKYFCHYCLQRGLNEEHPLIQECIHIVNIQLKRDEIQYHNYHSNITLVSKWIPREKSKKFGWLYQYLAYDYYSHYFQYTKTEESLKKACLKAKTDYRKLISSLNKKLDTLQIKQCDKKWSNINFHNVTSISLSKQKNAFLNVTKGGRPRSFSEDRVECTENFKEFVYDCKKKNIEIKGSRIGLNDFTKYAIEIIDKKNKIGHYDETLTLEKDILQSQWEDHSKSHHSKESFGNMIAMADFSGSMCGDPMNCAIALAIRVAEHSVFGKRVITFSSSPKWVNLEKCNDFVEMVELLMSSDWGFNTNLYAAFDLILEAIVESNISSEKVTNMVLAIFSDMQIDQADKMDKSVLYDIIQKKYYCAGMKSIYKKPYTPPHILFWNLRCTDGFPCLSIQTNVSMMSGFHSSLLNLFCDNGLNALQSCTPWSNLEKILSNKRYNILGDKIKEYSMGIIEK